MRPKTRQELANEYQIDRKTLYRRLKKSGIELENGLIFPKKLTIIYQTFGLPKMLSDKENNILSGFG